MGIGILLLLLLPRFIATAAVGDEMESEESRKILGSSVVTSVSVIMDTGNGSKAVFTDAVGKPMTKPSAAAHLASPINLLNPDRYEFYTFDDSGDLVKRLMTLEEIQQIIASGDGDGMTYHSDSVVDYSPEKKVDDVVNNVQNVLKEEIEKNSERPVMNDLSSSSWTMVLPAVFGNSGEEVVPDGNLIVATPETIMIEPTSEAFTTSKQQTNSEITATNLDKESMSTLVTVADQSGDESVKKTTLNLVSENATNTPLEKLSTFIPAFPTSVSPDTSPISLSSSSQAPTTDNQKYNTLPVSTTDFEIRQTTTEFLSNQDNSVTLSADSQKKTTEEPQSITTNSQTSPPSSLQDFDINTTSNSDDIVTTQKYRETSPQVKITTENDVTSQTTTSTISNQQFNNVESTKIPIPAEAFPSSTYSFLTTFFGMNAIQNGSTANPQLSDVATTASSDISSTQQHQEITEGPSTIDALDIEKLAVTELLDQLLSSTKIYQLNDNLAQDEENKLEGREPTEQSKIETTTTVAPEVTTKFEQNVISSIEQLLSQAMGTHVEEAAENSTQQGEKINDFLLSMGQKNMTEVQQQTATVMSSLMGNLDADLIKQQNEVSTYKNTLQNESVGTEEPPSLDESIDSFISQVVLEEVSNATTIVDELPTASSTTHKNDVTTEALLPKIEEIELNLPTTTNAVVTTETDGATTVEALKDSSTIEIEDIQTTASETQETTVTEAESTESKTENGFSTTTDSLATTTQKEITTKDDLPSTTILNDFTTNVPTETTKSANTVESNIKWAPVSTIVQSTSSPTEKLPSIITNPTTPIAPSVDLSSQISAGFGLEDTTSQLDPDIYQFVQLCNELAFNLWKSTSESLSPSRSLVISPFAATSLLAMVFLGARGATSGEMNEILRLDDMVTFNPHLIFRNVTESIEVSKRAGVSASAIVRQLYSDKTKGKLLSFYKERARQFYDGHVEEANFKEIGDIIRRRTNLLVKRYTWNKIHEFIKENSVMVRAPLAGVSVNIFQTDCSVASTTGRDGEIYFQVSPTIRQRRLIPIPAAVWRSGFLAGYEPGLDATAVAIGAKDQLISTIFIMPGQQGIAAPGDGLARLEQHLVDGALKEGSWTRLLKSLIPRVGLEVQIPRFYHKSFVNATMALQKMGLKDLFDSKKADLRGLNGVSHELYLSDLVQINNFATCGESRIDETHHVETYPSISSARSTRKLGTMEESERSLDEGAGFHDYKEYQRGFDNVLFDSDYLTMPLPLRPRQARVPEVPKLRFDRPFLYFVRHNPTGLIMHMGRFHPRLLP